jgi:hypothetical protein
MEKLAVLAYPIVDIGYLCRTFLAFLFLSVFQEKKQGGLAIIATFIIGS